MVPRSDGVGTIWMGWTDGKCAKIVHFGHGTSTHTAEVQTGDLLRVAVLSQRGRSEVGHGQVVEVMSVAGDGQQVVVSKNEFDVRSRISNTIDLCPGLCCLNLLACMWMPG